MNKLLATAFAAVMFCAPVLAANAPDTPVVTGPNFQQVPAAQLMVTPSGGAQQTLGAALAAGGGGGSPPSGNVNDIQVKASGTTFGALTPGTGVSTALSAALNGTGALVGSTGAAIAASTLSATGAVNTTGTAGYQLGGTTFINTQNGGPALQYNIVTDPSLLTSGLNRQNIIQTTLTNSVTNSNTWESFTSALTLNGPGQNQAEINNFHGFFDVAAGAVFATGENFEASDFNFGTVSSISTYESLFHNMSTGTTGGGGVNMYVANLQNDNTTANSINVYQGFTCNPMAGAGTLPQFDFCIRNSNPHGTITTAGKVEIGSATTTPTAWLQYNGPDTVAGTLAMSLLNSASTVLFQVADNGATTFGTITGSTQCLQVSSTGLLSGTGAACGGGSGAVSSVANSDGTLTISPTTGAVVASLNLAHANTWTGEQQISVASGTGLKINGPDTSSGTFPLIVSTPGINLMLLTDSGVLSVNQNINIGQTGGTGANTGSLNLNGSVSGSTRLIPSSSTLVTNATLTLPQVTDTLAVLGTAQTFTAKQTLVASTATTAGFNLPQGAAPTSPINGDIWTTSGGVFAQIAGATVGPFGTGGGGGAVSAVSNSDGTLTISPTTGAVVASLALGHANTWTAAQTFSATTTTAGIADSVQVSSPILNFTTSVNLSGARILSVGANQNTYLGLTAGAANTSGVLSTFLGNGAGQSNTTGGENTFVGTIAGQLMTTGTFNTAVGEHAMGQETSILQSTAIGNDSQRNLISNSGANTTAGKSAMYAGGSSQSTAIGAQSLQGNGSAVAVGGTAAAGDVLQLTFTGAFTGSPISVTTTVTAGQSLNSMATALFNAVIANTTLANPLIVDANTTTSGVDGATGNIIFRFRGTGSTGLNIVVTGSVTGAATETLAITNGSVGSDNIAVGYQAMMGNYLSTAARNISIGDTTTPLLSTGNDNVTVGTAAGPSISTSTQNVLIGSQAGGILLATGGGNVIVGYRAQVTVANENNSVIIGSNVGGGALGAMGGSSSVVIGATTGNAGLIGGAQTIIGRGVGSTTDATGTNVVLIGTSSSCDTPTSSTSNYVALCANAGPVFSVTGTNTPSTSATTIAGSLNVVGTLSQNGTTILQWLTGTTGSIGGSALLAGACTSGTVAVTGSTTAMAVVATPVTYPGDGFDWEAFVSAAGTVTVKVCGFIAGTPVASAYNVRVLQ